MSHAAGSSVFNIKHETDPVADIQRAVGNLKDFRVAPAKLLLGIYKRPEKIGSIIRPESHKEEDIFQGKVGLVLKAGPLAFANDDNIDFGGFSASVGDWVVFRINDGRRLDVCGENGTGWECCLIKDVHIGMVIPDPAKVW